MRKLLSLMLLIAVLAALPPADAQTLTGWIVTVYGDPLPDSAQTAVALVLLQAADGSSRARLQMPYAEAMPYIGREVRIEGTLLSDPTTAAGQALPVIQVMHIQPTDEISTAAIPTGTHRWLNLLCRFADSDTLPYPDDHYTRLFSDTSPGIGHYWREISENQINIDDTQTVFQWFVLPHPNSTYVNASGVNLTAMFQDCTEAANASVNFASFEGVNLLFNGEVGAAGWGGQHIFALDGPSRMLRVTWMPPRGHTHALIAHEMGHGWGLPHSSGPAHNPPTGSRIYVSAWDVMSRYNGTCSVSDSDLGCLGPGTIAYYTHMLGWLPDSRLQTVAAGNRITIPIERLRLTQNRASTALVIVPIAGSDLRFYTIEVRDLSGYDQNVPGQAVILHRVDLDTLNSTNTGPALVVDADDNGDVNDAGAMWTAGETFYDAEANIEIAVLGSSGATYTVRVGNDAPPLMPEAIQTAAPVFPVIPTPTPPFVLTLPVLTNIDGGGLDWSAAGGWTTAAASNFTGTGGLGWQIGGSPAGLYPLQWQHSFTLVGVSRPQLSFAYRLISAGSTGQVELRTAGGAWAPLAVIAPAADWQTSLIDLSAYSGQIVELRFVWNSSGSAGDTWQVDNLYLFNLPETALPARDIRLDLPVEIVPPPAVTLVPVSPG